MKRLLFAIMFVLPAHSFLVGSELPDMPMSANHENSLEYQWARKTVHESSRLSGMEDFNAWRHEGFGSLQLSHDISHEGRSSLLLTSPTKGKEPGDVEGRPFGAASAIYPVAGEDWSEWNRISFWVYPDLPGFRTVSLSLVFHNDGEEKVPGPYNRNGLNYVLLENHEWNHIYWEIAHLGREKVTAVELRYRLQGNEPGATDTVRYYFDEMDLQKVDADHYEGWRVAPEQIAFSHSGYVIGHPKTALASALPTQEFSVVNVKTGEPVLRKEITEAETSLGKFLVLDFSELNRSGTFRLEAGVVQTRPFRIGSFREIYRETIVKTINHFYSQRCGTAVPGIHATNHRDWTSTHGDDAIVINGGWHDAGDLSQGLVNTSEATYAMLALAQELEDTDPGLSERLVEEAKWGLDWILKTRFGDGYRTSWATMDFWTDGIIGNVDDVVSEARNSPYDNFLAAKAEAKAAKLLMDRDSIRARYALKSAAEDWQFAQQSGRDVNLDIAAAGLNASLSLYEVIGDEKYREAALDFADYIMRCQQQENLSEDVTLKGFFYRDTSRNEILHYSHRGHEQEPVVGLVRMAEMFSGSPDVVKWEKTLRLYADYYKQLATYTDPYFMIPAGIYDLTKAEDATERQQILNGTRLNGRYYLKAFPVWKTFRGNEGAILSQTKGLTSIANHLNDRELLNLCYRQLQWTLGLNPFNQSLMYGEGYNFAAQYSAMSGNIVGGLPVGIQTHFNRDKPYWPAENCYNWKEIWVHPSSRWLWIMKDFYSTYSN